MGGCQSIIANVSAIMPLINEHTMHAASWSAMSQHSDNGMTACQPATIPKIEDIPIATFAAALTVFSLLGFMGG